MGQFGFVAIGTLRGGANGQKIVGPSLVAAGFGVTSFRIRHESSLGSNGPSRPRIPEIQQRGQSRIADHRVATATVTVSVPATGRTEPPTAFLTKRFYRQIQKDLLANDVAHIDKISREKPDFQILFLESDLAGKRMVGVGLIILIEMGRQSIGQDIQAASTGQLHFSAQRALDPHSALRLSLSPQIDRHLAGHPNLTFIQIQVTGRQTDLQESAVPAPIP